MAPIIIIPLSVVPMLVLTEVKPLVIEILSELIILFSLIAFFWVAYMTLKEETKDDISDE